MPEKKESIQAIHGRRINEIQESLESIKQEISLLDTRVSAFEREIAERSKSHREIKNKISSLRAELERKLKKI